MGVPEKHAIPNRKQWQKLRDAAGGKSGDAKVSVGDTLDSFHKALDKAQKADDLKLVNNEINKLTKVVDAYIAQVGKKNKDLAKVVKDKIKFPLQDFIANCSDSKSDGDKGQEDTKKQMAAAIKGVKGNEAQLKELVSKTSKAISNIGAQIDAGKIPTDMKKKLVAANELMAKNYDKMLKASVKRRQSLLDDEAKLGKDIDAGLKKDLKKALADLDEHVNEAAEIKAKLLKYKKDLK